MRGKKARALRKMELPPSLRKERRDRIGVLAAARNEIVNEARTEFELGVEALRSAKNAKQDAAYATFNEQRAAVRADIDKKAAPINALAESA